MIMPSGKSKPTPFERYVTMYNGKLPTEFDPNYLELLRMSKYVILETPMHQPGKCANCGSSKNDGRKYIDFGTYVEWFGQLYLCGLCMRDAADTMGLFDTLKQELAEAKMKTLNLNILRDKGDKIQDTFLHTYEEVKKYFDELNVQYVSDNFVPRDSVGVESDETKSDGTGVDKPQPITTAAKPRTSKSTSSAGPKNVPSLASLLESES